MQNTVEAPDELRQEIACLWNTLYPAATVAELRAPKAGKYKTVSGYFDNPADLFKAALQWDGQANVYIVLNPVNPALLARRENRAQAYAENTTQDADIPRLQWLLIDFDAQRPAGISSSDAEHANALALAGEVRECLLTTFAVPTVFADSGNGAHLLLPVDLPNEAANVTLLKAVLAGLAFRFDTSAVHIDLSTFNPSRLVKLYGTLACKGDSTEGRPHRRARLLDIPGHLPPTPQDILQQIAAFLPEPEQDAPPRITGSGGSFDLRAFMDTHGLQVHAETPYNGGTRYQLKECPFNPQHGAKESAVFQYASGGMHFKCFHASCAGKDWRALREHFEPGYRDRRSDYTDLQQNRKSQSGYEKNEISACFTQPGGVISHNSLFSQVETPKKIDPAAYYGLAGEFVNRVEPHTESDPVALLIQFLTAFGSVIGRNAYFRVESSRHYMNLFSVLVGNSAKARKGTSLQNVLETIKTADTDWYDNRIQSGLSSGEGMLHAVRDPIEAEEDIKEKGKVIGRQTVLKDAGIEDKRLLVTEAEFARTLRVMERDGSTLSALLRDAWDSGKLRVLTKNPQNATGAHISVIGHITQDELRRLLTDTEAANGFANRFLWVYTERSKLLPDGGRLWQEDLTGLHTRIYDAVQFASAAGEMKRDAEAGRLWAGVYGELTRPVSGLFGSVTARADAQTLRLSCLYALLDSSPVVRGEHLEAALAVWQYAEDSARYIFGDALGDPIADEILRALQNSPAGMTRTEINTLFGRHLKSERIGQALHTLAEGQRIVCETRPGENGGRPAELWKAVQEVSQ